MPETTENQALASMFIRPKPVWLLIHAKIEQKPYASTLAKKIDCTYAHTVKLLQKMESAGLVKFKKSGRINYVSLTDFGSDLADEFDLLVNRRMTRAPAEAKAEETP